MISEKNVGYKLYIDNREQEIKKYFENKDDIIFNNLDIGDIIIKRDEDIILIFERKTIKDLSASICDGRNREQKLRLLGSGIDRDRIMYIIEGNIRENTRVKGGTNTIIGSIINTLFRDGIKIYKSISIDETIYFIEKLFDKIKNNIDEYWKYNKILEINNTKYSATLKKKKKDNMTEELWFHAQLELIPGVSNKIAETITNKYSRLKSLIDMYSKLDIASSKKLLQELSYNTTNNKTRKIGPILSERIYTYIYKNV